MERNVSRRLSIIGIMSDVSSSLGNSLAAAGAASAAQENEMPSGTNGPPPAVMKDDLVDSYLVQILLPLDDNEGDRFPDALFLQIQKTLTERFGGLTAYSRAPGKGIWSQDGLKVRDDIVVVEVMTKTLDTHWWQAFRRELEDAMRQEQLVIRIQSLKIV
jgi:hypothetical protein